ncbi:hypothetical protein N1851_027139 [Merluccius polli]|uniref:Endonuclease/exonuclease/phosphatase domain-containing protein n=1 Tax=Merluccius polli TaxID=89951 RepID=A0AA47MAM2_MERPO|nr:hypothetical protein N1851_027139 [Merluccius polli]
MRHRGHACPGTTKPHIRGKGRNPRPRIWIDIRLTVAPRATAQQDPAITRKTRGGGCRTVVVRESLCTPDIELLCVSLRPFYLPREFPQIFLTVVYIHPKANFDRALDIIFNLSHKLDLLSPDAPKFILGDFNNCPVKKCLRTYYQYVDWASDHNVVYLRPIYQRLLQREKPQERSIKVWNNDSIMALQGCFDCTNWDTFKCPDINEQVETISEFLCRHSPTHKNH